MSLNAHLKYRKIPFNPDVPESIFTENEIAILQDYGTWFSALMSKKIKPETPAQMHFIKVCDGAVEPANQYERAWAHFIKRKIWESENPEFANKTNLLFAELGITGNGWGVYGHFR